MEVHRQRVWWTNVSICQCTRREAKAIKNVSTSSKYTACTIVSGAIEQVGSGNPIVRHAWNEGNTMSSLATP